jgi:EAL domain-containing protein (putative c-di-GMP-specific phosphodiesterase class I)
VQFRHARLSELVGQLLKEAQVSPERLELELTESAMMRDPLAAIDIMNALHQRGVTMSIDDFGTGYSSLAYLKRFNVSQLKIDQSFVRELVQDADTRAIVATIIRLAHDLNIHTIAEGVETLGQLTLLGEMGCEAIQGYYLSRPLPQAELLALLRSSSTFKLM